MTIVLHKVPSFDPSLFGDDVSRDITLSVAHSINSDNQLVGLVSFTEAFIFVKDQGAIEANHYPHPIAVSGSCGLEWVSTFFDAENDLLLILRSSEQNTMTRIYAYGCDSSALLFKDALTIINWHRTHYTLDLVPIM